MIWVAKKWIFLVTLILVSSCGKKLSEIDSINLATAPTQTVDDMYIIQTENGVIQMRVLAGRMEKYTRDSLEYELFPKGIEVYSYEEDGTLQSTIKADEARHDKSDKAEEEEVWKAYGNVVVKNIPKQETLETDTLYWDRINQEISTDCYVRMYSPDGFMQGFGMRSDERAENAIILRPFNSFTYVVEDTTVVLIDSANFIGPLLKN